MGDDVVRHGRVSDAKMAEIADTLASFHGACQLEGTLKTVAVGTAAFRDAPNGARVVEIASRLGVRMEIASEQRESDLAYLVGSLGRPDFAVIDNGSRSIELVARGSGAAQHAVFNLGYRIAWEEFFAKATDPAKAIALTFAEAFGYPQIELTARQLGVGLIIEAGLDAAAPR